jgi:hypothetical protein
VIQGREGKGRGGMEERNDDEEDDGFKGREMEIDG